MPDTIRQRCERVLISILESPDVTDDQWLEAAQLLAVFRKIKPAGRRKRTAKPTQTHSSVLGTK